MENTEQMMKPENEAELMKQAVEAARSEWEAEIEARIAEAFAQGERAAGMSAEEKLAERERKLAERERQMKQKELRARLELRLIEDGLPRQLAEALNYWDEATAERSYEAVKQAFLDTVQARVSEVLGTIEPPKSGKAIEAEALTDEQYYAMHISGR